MSDEEREEILRQSEAWGQQRLDEKFQKQQFIEIGKEDDYCFQVLVFLGEASGKLSLARTIANREKGRCINAESVTRLDDLQKELHRLVDDLRATKTGGGNYE